MNAKLKRAFKRGGLNSCGGPYTSYMRQPSRVRGGKETIVAALRFKGLNLETRSVWHGLGYVVRRNWVLLVESHRSASRIAKQSPTVSEMAAASGAIAAPATAAILQRSVKKLYCRRQTAGYLPRWGKGCGVHGAIYTLSAEDVEMNQGLPRSNNLSGGVELGQKL